MAKHDNEFYPTPEPLTTWMLKEVAARLVPVSGKVLESCAGAGDIAAVIKRFRPPDRYGETSRNIFVYQNDIDPQWTNCRMQFDATIPDSPLRKPSAWRAAPNTIDSFQDDGVNEKFAWEVTNPPFDYALQIMIEALRATSVGVAFYHRCTLREPLKTPNSLGRTFFREHPPTMTLWCPRFAHRRSRKTGKWSTDSATCVWSVWVHGAAPVGDVWPTDDVFTALDDYTPTYRDRVDRLTGWSK